MASLRIQRIQNLLRAEISTILQRKLKDPRVKMVTIISIEVSADLGQARVFISVYGGRKLKENALEGLRSAAGFIRSELMRELHLRPMPHLEFHTDESLDRGARTLDLLEQIRYEREQREARAALEEPAEPQGGARASDDH
jgi:ribosome-binding factor A